MLSSKDYFKEKTVGFYIAIGAAALSFITAIVYVACYANGRDLGIGKLSQFMSWPTFVFSLLAAISFSVAAVFNQSRWGNLAMVFFNLLALVFYIRHIYNYIAIVATGIDLNSFGGEFWASIILLSLSFVLSNVTVYFRHIKTVKASDTVSEVKEAQ